ncbi:MAG: hypothetical protein HY079_05680 [Elusimicrobia bacterium]|nr:hypothetical protein [Elusimicrobiota bacterium]
MSTGTDSQAGSNGSASIKRKVALSPDATPPATGSEAVRDRTVVLETTPEVALEPATWRNVTGAVASMKTVAPFMSSRVPSASALRYSMRCAPSVSEKVPT